MGVLVRIQLLILVLCSCTRIEVTERSKSMRFDREALLGELSGQVLSQENLIKTAKRLKEHPFGDTLTFGQCKVSSSQYADFLMSLSPQSEVALYEVYGREEWGEILLTSYFSPIYQGRSRPIGEFIQPVYRVPKDLVEVKVNDFSHEDLLDQELSRKVVSGRITKGPGAISRVIPFYSRREIDIDHKLSDRKLEIAYMRPVDAFVLQIQGSGRVVFPSGREIELGYGAQNGHRYFSVGKALLDIIPKEEMSLQRIKIYLATLSQKDLYEFLAKNASYVFFKEMKKRRGLTTFGLPPVPLETLAIDSKIFPLGALAYLSHPSPIENENGEASFEKRERFVLSHDTGGAIKGGGRADLYWGVGEEAEKAAGLMRHKSRLWFIAPKECSSNH